MREIGEACERWGIFHMVNHGIPNGVIKKVLEAIGEFHEQPKEEKMKWYSRSKRLSFIESSNFKYSKLHWRDSISNTHIIIILNSKLNPIQFLKKFINIANFIFIYNITRLT